jgi:hypothetical protein
MTTTAASAPTPSNARRSHRCRARRANGLTQARLYARILAPKDFTARWPARRVDG